MISPLELIHMIRDIILPETKQKKPLKSIKQIHVDLLPKGFKMPSILIEYVSDTTKDGTVHYVQKTAYMTITVFTFRDEYHQSKTSDLLTLQDEVSKLFRSGYIILGETAIRIKATNGGRGWNEAYIDLQLEYFDCRSDVVDESEIMENLHTRVINETDKNLIGKGVG